MRYTRNSKLLPCTPEELGYAKQVQYHDLIVRDLLLFDETVSDFFFEFEPEHDIELFLQHAHFGEIREGIFVASQEDLFAVAALDTGHLWQKMIVDLASTMPAPFKFNADHAAFEAIARGGEYRGQVTVCSCGIAGCFSQYVWAQDGRCLALFTINGACLTDVAWCPFRFDIQSVPG